MRTRYLGLAVAIATSGCAIQHNVTPVTRVEGRKVCIIQNDEVQDPVIVDTYSALLVGKGYEVTMLSPRAKFSDCAVTSTYRGHWKWDMTQYLAYAEIKVYSKGRKIGEASYDTSGAALSAGKFTSPRQTITELVDRLFPRAQVEE